jgi:hypothetical protein
MNKNIECDLHIGQPRGGSGPEIMTIEVTDRASHIRFLSLEVPLASFMKAITGQFLSEIQGSVMGLEEVGKTRVTETRQIVCPLKTYKREEMREWLEANAQEAGWIIDSYLGSQGSVTSHPEGSLLSYRVHKFVETP